MDKTAETGVSERLFILKNMCYNYMYCCIRHSNTSSRIKRSILSKRTSFIRTKVIKRLRVSKPSPKILDDEEF